MQQPSIRSRNTLQPSVAPSLRALPVAHSHRHRRSAPEAQARAPKLQQPPRGPRAQQPDTFRFTDWASI